MTITVSLADDHTVVRKGLRAYLNAQLDINVIGEAGNRRDAVERIADLEPDVAVLGIGIPDVNGVEATEEIYRRSRSV